MLVALVWAASMTATFTVDGYDPPAGIHGAMTMVCTVLFGSHLVRRNGNH